MKELSIEEKVKAYDKAIEVARKYRKDCKRNRWVTECMEDIFPELKESEDERIRKELLEHCKNQAKPYIQTGNKCPQIQSWIDWLEKKGKQNYKIIKGKNYLCVKTHNYAGVEWIKGTKYYASDNYTLVNQGCECYSPEYSKEEHNNLFEEVIADKVEPKFKVGDWVVVDDGRTGRIVECTKDYADIDLEFSRLSTGVNNIRSWTIEDAKDGDVLSFNDGHGNDCIELIKSITNEKIEFWFCLTNGNRYEVFDGIIPYTNLTSREGSTPATKEQRDLLFSKMSEAGYEWDAEKKELKKVGPKFKVGDWCIDNEDGTIFQIVKVLDNTYTYKTNEGREYPCSHYSLENDARLWTIQDSKNADVLATPDGYAFISRGCIDKFHPDKPVAYCGLDCDGCFSIPSGITWWTDDEIHPATKKERDLLFSKMHKAGYEWDAEKKELKVIEETPTELAKGEDYGIDGLYAAIDILKKTLGNVDGYQTDDGILEHECAISAVKKLYEQKPAWSEEDETMINHALQIIKEHWNSLSDTDYDGNEKTESCYNGLKYLKERIQSQYEWKQENTDDLTDFENAMMHIGGSFFGENAGLDPNDTNAIKEQANLLLELVPKQEWSEEDENINQSIIDILTKQGFQTQVNWLKSLKDRVQPQPKLAWSEEDEKILATIIEEGDLKPSERQWLKSIIPRSKWISVDKDIYISDPVVAQLKNIEASDAFDGYVLCADHTLSPDVYARYMPIEDTETMAVNFV